MKFWGKNGVIINDDCLNAMQEIKDKSVDLIVTDPPYGISSEVKISRGRNTMKYKGKDLSHNFGDWDKFDNLDDFMNFTFSWLDLCASKLKDGGIFITYFDKDKVNFISHYLQNKYNFKCKGYYADCKCLSGNTEVYIKKDKIINSITLKELFHIYKKDIKILTPDGFKDLKLIKRNRNEQSFKLKTYFGNVESTGEHQFPIFKHERRLGKRKKAQPDIRVKAPKNKIQFINVNVLKQEQWQRNLIICPVLSQDFIKYLDRIKLDYDFGWIIGLFLAEGNFNKTTQIRFSLHKKEIIYYEKIKDYFERFKFFNSKMQPNGIKVYKFIKNNSMAVYFGSKKFTHIFQKIILNKGAKFKRINHIYILNTNKNFRKGILDGFIDGDGYKNIKRNQITIGICNKELRNDLQLLSSTLNIPTSISEHKVKYQNGYKKMFRLYFLNKRKIREGKESKIGRDFNFYSYKIVNIKEEDNQPTYDISVEGELFVCNRGIISHNSNPVPQAHRVKWMNGWEISLLMQKPGGKLTYNYKLGQQKDYGIRPIVGGHERTKHPTQKPLKVINLFIEYWSNQGDTILDPFLGSGTTAVACRMLDRRYIGIERDKKYYDIAVKRVKKAEEIQYFNFEEE